MFATAIIVFREVLEAALLVGIVAAATRSVPGRTSWLAAGILAGLVGAGLVALFTESIASFASGMGQELFNATILGIAVLMLAWHNIWMSAHGATLAADAKRVGGAIRDGRRECSVLLVVVGVAVLREGAETVLFVVGSLTGGGTVGAASVLLACALGLFAGAVVGVGLYAGLSRIPTQKLFAATNVLIALLAASIASQLARALTQAGLVERGTAPLWDSSAWLASDSALGALLHALVGYDARPSALQLGFYVAVLAVIYMGTRLVMRQLTVNPLPRRTSLT